MGLSFHPDCDMTASSLFAVNLIHFCHLALLSCFFILNINVLDYGHLLSKTGRLCCISFFFKR